MKRTIALIMLLAGVAGSMLAGNAPSPEIDATTGVAAISLISGAILVLRTRRRK